MSVTIRPFRNGGWEVDITTRLPDGSRYRERIKAPCASKTAAQRWGDDRERHVLRHGVAPSQKEVPTLAEFAPRFVDGAQTTAVRVGEQALPTPLDLAGYPRAGVQGPNSAAGRLDRIWPQRRRTSLGG